MLLALLEVRNVHVVDHLVGIIIPQSCHEPHADHLSEHLRDLWARSEITALIEDGVLGAIIAVLGVHEGELHEPGKRHWGETSHPDLVFDHLVEPLDSLLLLW